MAGTNADTESAGRPLRGRPTIRSRFESSATLQKKIEYTHRKSRLGGETGHAAVKGEKNINRIDRVFMEPSEKLVSNHPPGVAVEVSHRAALPSRATTPASQISLDVFASDLPVELSSEI